MIEVIILFVLGLLWSGFGSIQDFKKREIANWVSFSLIIFALGFRFFYSLFSESGFNFFYEGLIGFVVFFLLGNLLYYSRFFAGGDEKLFIAFGTIIPFSIFTESVMNLFLFLFLFLFVGAVYGIICSIYYSVKNWSDCKREFKKQFKKNKKILIYSTILGILFLCCSFVNFVFVFFGLMFFIFPYLYIFAKSIDEVCMVKIVKPSELTGGDWLYGDVKVGNKVVKSKWDGLTNEEIKLIRKSKLKKIKIKYGIAFIPVFFLSLLLFILIYFR